MCWVYLSIHHVFYCDVRKSVTRGFSECDLIHVSQSFPELLIKGSGRFKYIV